MSANKHKTKVAARQLSTDEKQDRRMWRLSREVSLACDDFFIRRNGYKPDGFRSIINASVLQSQSERA